MGRFGLSFGFGLPPCKLKPALLLSDAAYDLGLGRSGLSFGFGLRPCEPKPALLISAVAYDLGLARSGKPWFRPCDHDHAN